MNMMRAKPKSLSVIVPIYNEAESLGELKDKLLRLKSRLNQPFEIIAVNDGSHDGSAEALAGIAAEWPEFKVINFRRNHGQTAAMMAGIDYASGDVIVSIDADLQNDPDDIPMLLEHLDKGYDVVSGWRQDRKDAALRRNLVSRIANSLISRISGVRLHDYGCTLKAYRRDVIKGVRLYGEMHRFIPIYASWLGAKVTEVPVRHYPRKFGSSKYGLERTIKVVLDLIVVKFLARYFVKPIYVFGTFGIMSIVTSFLSVFLMLYLKFADDVSMIQTPLPVFSAMAFLVGMMSILMGLLAEMIVRTYFESQHRAIYTIRDVINLPPVD